VADQQLQESAGRSSTWSIVAEACCETLWRYDTENVEFAAPMREGDAMSPKALSEEASVHMAYLVKGNDPAKPDECDLCAQLLEAGQLEQIQGYRGRRWEVRRYPGNAWINARMTPDV
jgi:hypothetical protein